MPGRISDRLQELGISLPEPVAPVAVVRRRPERHRRLSAEPSAIAQIESQQGPFEQAQGVRLGCWGRWRGL